ncbi:MAG: M48 family metallopeptidase [Candidatus Methylarchaceae archaeon HK02M2]|nr:M48 family metallopeptidase [Candidatus Methylarchaceae archaeon HK02M2]
MPKLSIGDKEIDYRVKRGRGRKYVYLRFTKNFELEIILPKDSNVKPEEIIRKKRPWIERKYQELSERKQIFDVGGNKVLYKGKYHDLEVITSEKATIKMDKEKIILSTPDDMDHKTLLKNWMKRKTKSYLKRKIPTYADKFGIEINDFKVRNMKKWGTCNRKGELTFSSQLIALPEELVEYIILHEISHLSEFNHSKNFRCKLASLCPDYIEREMMLKNIVPIS